MPYKYNPLLGIGLDEVGTGGGGGGSSTLGGLTDVTVSAPSAWQVLGYDADAGVWKNTSHIHGNLAGGIYIHIKNTDSVQLDKGTPFYITGTVGASDQVEVQAADSADPLKGPAVGLVEEDLAVNGEGNGVIIGEIFQFDTATPSWSTNDALYVANTGGLTNVQPTSGYRQIIAYVGRVHASTGTLVLTGASVDPVAGSNGQVQFNDNGGFGGDAGLTYNKTTDELTVAGDINLDDGGTFSTTVQSVTPTANRTISFPDATGTVALVSGANGTIQYNEGGALKGNSDFTVNVDWDNPATTFTALKVNVPDTTQGAADSTLLDLQSGGSSRLYATNTGALYLGSSGSTAIIGSINRPSTRIEIEASDHYYFYSNGGPHFGFTNGSGFAVGGTYFIGWGSTFSKPGHGASVLDTRLYRDGAAGIVAQRNGTNAQTFRLYNTYTDASNFENLQFSCESNELRIGAAVGSTGGTERIISLGSWNNAGGFTPYINYGAGLTEVQFRTAIQLTPDTPIQWRSGSTVRNKIEAPSDGTLTFKDWFGNGNMLMQVGGSTSSFPALKRSNETLQVRLADDSGYTTIDAQLRAQGAAPASATAAGTAGDIRYDADYIYVCTATDTWKRAALATW